MSIKCHLCGQIRTDSMGMYWHMLFDHVGNDDSWQTSEERQQAYDLCAEAIEYTNSGESKED